MVAAANTIACDEDGWKNSLISHRLQGTLDQIFITEHLGNKLWLLFIKIMSVRLLVKE